MFNAKLFFKMLAVITIGATVVVGIVFLLAFVVSFLSGIAKALAILAIFIVVISGLIASDPMLQKD